MRSVKIMAIVAVMAGSANLVQAANHYYRYKDTNGKWVMTSTIPAEKAKLGYEIIDENGKVIEKIDGEVTGSDLDDLKKKRQAEISEKERIKKQQEYDLSLIRRYSFVEDIEAEKKRKLTELNATLSIVKGNLNSVRAELEAEYARAAGIERQDKPLPDDLKKRIADVEAVVISTEDLYKLREQNIKTTTADYDRAIKRFQELQILRGKKPSNN